MNHIETEDTPCCADPESCCETSGPEINVLASSSRRKFLSRSAKITTGVVLANSFCKELQADPFVYGPLACTGGLSCYYCCLTGSAFGSGSEMNPDVTEFATSGIDTDINNDLAQSVPTGWEIVTYSHSGFKGTIPATLKMTPTADAVVTRGSPYDPADCQLIQPSQSYNGAQPVSGHVPGSIDIRKKKPNPPLSYWTAKIPFTCSLSGSLTAEEDGAWFDDGGPKTEITYPCERGDTPADLGQKKCTASGTVQGKFKHLLEMGGSTNANWDNTETGQQDWHEVKLQVKQYSLPKKNIVNLPVKLQENCPTAS